MLPVLHSFICIMVYLLLLYPQIMLNRYTAINIFPWEYLLQGKYFLGVKQVIGEKNKGHTFLLPIFRVGNIFTQGILFLHM